VNRDSRFTVSQLFTDDEGAPWPGARRGRFAYRERVLRPDGTVRVLDTIGEVVPGEGGKPAGLLGTCRDITEEEALGRARVRAARVQAGERHVLELLASGVALDDVLEALVRIIEELSPETFASILLLEGETMRHAAGRSLPEEYRRAIDGSQIGPAAGSCGTAAFRKSPVFVDDIFNDPLWADYRRFAQPHGLRACWSMPLFGSDGRVLGTFAMYYRTVKSADAEARDLITRAAHVAGIAIERRQLDDQLRALSQRVEQAREEERTSIAREIHDELGQALTALKLDVAWVARRTRAIPEAAAKLEEMARGTDELLLTVRRISSELRPGVLDTVGLRAAIVWQAEEFTRRTGVPCVVKAEIGELQLERGLTTAAFRIFQEALTNVTRHAKATKVDVSLKLERGNLLLEVADDGVGVPDISPRSSSLGLLGMRERARRCGGECTVKRREPSGTLVSLSVPLKFPSEGGEVGA
jgi:signal transduction histidine kinase